MQLNESATAFLREKIQTYITLSEPDFLAVAACFGMRHTAKNQLLLQEGEVCNFWGVMQQGLLRSFAYRDDGQEYSLGFLREGNFVCESLSFNRQTPSQVNVQALEDTTLLYLTHKRLHWLFAQYPPFESLARMLYEERIAAVKYTTLYMQQLNATNRYLHFLGIRPEIIKRVPLKYIASYLSITDSTLSRIRRKLSRSKS